MEFMVQIKASDFNDRHLKLSDVWTWSTELHDSEDLLVSVPLTEDSLSKVDSLLIRADFETAGGEGLHGLIVYAMSTADVFAIEILDGEKRFTFNKFAPDLSHEELIRLAACLGKEAANLLPIKYKVLVDRLAIPPGLFMF
jgi:hypothetical protein